jgi:cytochrome c oxidase assembly protein subunit 15
MRLRSRGSNRDFSAPDWLTFRRFAGFTTVLTIALIALGIYTAARGAGLACSQQWPLCDGGVLPQSLPSFIEWSHRLVAMITGWFILGIALWAWRRGKSRATRAFATLAVVLLPLQISIGAVTVTLNGLLPGGYSTPTHAAHLVVALVIFGSLVLTTLYAGGHERNWQRTARNGLVLAVIALPIGAVFSRVTAVPEYSQPAQAVFYAVSLLAVAGLLAAIVALGRVGQGSLRMGAVAALTFTLGHLLLGRDLVFYTPSIQRLNAGLLIAAFAFTVATAWLAYRRTRRDEAGGTVISQS